MGAGHDHGPVKTPKSARKYILAFLVPLIVVTAAGLVLLWPKGDVPAIPSGDYVAGEVTQVKPCQPAQPDCITAVTTITDGDHAGDTAEFTMSTGPGNPEITAGTQVSMTVATIDGKDEYGFSDVKRSQPLIILAILFAVAVVAISRLKGVAAIAGLAVSILLLGKFVLPALIVGTSPLAVAAVGAAAIAIPSMALAHGFNLRTGVALIGTILALLVTLFLGTVFTAAASFTGMASEDAWYLQNSGMDITFDLKGIFIAGLVIGTLGVLNDITITQSAAVWEVRRANPDTTLRTMYSAGMRVGRDHVSATVNTLVLAYIGATLPLFLILVMSQAPLSQSLTNEVIATEIVRSLVGGLGIIAAIPVTTLLAAWVLSRSHDEIDDDHAIDDGDAPMSWADIRDIEIPDYPAATRPQYSQWSTEPDPHPTE